MIKAYSLLASWKGEKKKIIYIYIYIYIFWKNESFAVRNGLFEKCIFQATSSSCFEVGSTLKEDIYTISLTTGGQLW